MTRPRGALAATAAVAYLLLTVLVAGGATERVDVAAREYFRPDDVWGDLQIRVDVIVESLKPVRLTPLFALAVSAHRRSRANGMRRL